ncbi:AAA family ATPase, partial [Candidatus Roizmanbacteria bacterium]|nr:AAA family ATPase [Candidatus Roizmanbacteria bacterium]
AEILRDDLEASPPAKLSEVESAQKEILNGIKQLLDSGQIQLGNDGGDEAHRRRRDASFVDACRMVEAVSPAVVWFDEIEMGLTGQTGQAAATDLGRIFAFFLTWMQEKARGLFVAATANRIDLLPAEIIRKASAASTYETGTEILKKKC